MLQITKEQEQSIIQRTKDKGKKKEVYLFVAEGAPSYPTIDSNPMWYGVYSVRKIDGEYKVGQNRFLWLDLMDACWIK